jgi:hypothetical protein
MPIDCLQYFANFNYLFTLTAIKISPPYRYRPNPGQMSARKAACSSACLHPLALALAGALDAPEFTR